MKKALIVLSFYVIFTSCGGSDTTTTTDQDTTTTTDQDTTTTTEQDTTTTTEEEKNNTFFLCKIYLFTFNFRIF